MEDAYKLMEAGTLFHEAEKFFTAPRAPGQSKVSYAASKAIPLVTSAIGYSLTGSGVGAAMGMEAGFEISNAAETERERLHPVSKAVAKPDPVAAAGPDVDKASPAVVPSDQNPTNTWSYLPSPVAPSGSFPHQIHSHGPDAPVHPKKHKARHHYTTKRRKARR